MKNRKSLSYYTVPTSQPRVRSQKDPRGEEAARGAGLAAEVAELLESAAVTKVGFACDGGDLAKLSQSGVGVCPDAVLDVQPWCQRKLNVPTLPGLKVCCDRILGWELA